MDRLQNYDSDTEKSENTAAAKSSVGQPSGVPNFDAEWEDFARLTGCDDDKSKQSESSANNEANEYGGGPQQAYSPTRNVASTKSPASHKPLEDNSAESSSREHSGPSESEESEDQAADDNEENDDSEENEEDEDENVDSDISGKDSSDNAEETALSSRKNSDSTKKTLDDKKSSRNERKRSRSRSRHRRSRSRSGSRRQHRSRSRDRHGRSRHGHGSSSHRHDRHSRKRSHERRRSRSRSSSHGRDRDRRRFGGRDVPHFRRGNRREGIDRRSNASVAAPQSKPMTFKEKMRQQLLETQRNLIESQLANCSDSGAQASSSTAPVQPISKPMNIQALLAHGAGKGTPQQALAQAMAAVHQQAQLLTGVKVPEYYNMAAVNPLKYAEQIKKRKMLWSKTKDNKEADKQWMSTVFQQDSGGDNQTSKFRKLMGIKGSDGEVEVDEKLTEEQLRKQDELFRQLDRDYEFARMATHTHRGVGLGFQSQGLP